MRGSNSSAGDRAQAYTLEGFIGAIIVLTAVLFALQSVVITPTTGGAIDRSAQAQLQQEVQDSLVVAANDGDLSHIVRYWDNERTDDEFYHPHGYAPGAGMYTADDFANESVVTEAGFGTVLNETFLDDRGRNYNVVLTYLNEHGNATEETYLVYQGGGSPNEMTASYTVTLYDDQRLTAPNSTGITLADAGEPPIPDAGDDELYNVVEVRVVIW